MSTTAGKEESHGDAVSAPILQNTKPVTEGDEPPTYGGDLAMPHLSLEPQVPASRQPKEEKGNNPEAGASAPRKKAVKTW